MSLHRLNDTNHNTPYPLSTSDLSNTSTAKATLHYIHFSQKTALYQCNSSTGVLSSREPLPPVGIITGAQDQIRVLSFITVRGNITIAITTANSGTTNATSRRPMVHGSIGHRKVSLLPVSAGTCSCKPVRWRDVYMYMHPLEGRVALPANLGRNPQWAKNRPPLAFFRPAFLQCSTRQECVSVLPFGWRRDWMEGTRA